MTPGGERNGNTTQAATIATLSTKLDGVADSVGRIDASVTRTVGSLAKLTNQVSAMTARTNALLDRHQENIGVLFGELKDTNARVSRVKEQHIPENELRAAFREHGERMDKLDEESRDEFRRIYEKIEQMNARVNWILGIGTALVVIMEIARAVIPWVKG